MKYSKPVAELEKFTVADVVTTSSNGPIVTPPAE